MKRILTFWTCDRCNHDGENFDGVGRVQAESWIDAMKLGWKHGWHIGAWDLTHICPDCVRILREPNPSLFPGPKPEAKP